MTNETKRLILALEVRLAEYEKGKPPRFGSFCERVLLAVIQVFHPRMYTATCREAASEVFREMLKEEAETL